MIHPHLLFRPIILFNKDAPFSSKTSASLLSNPMYSLKLARSVVFVLDRQFVMKRNMATNLSKMIDMILRVSVVVVCPLMLGIFDSDSSFVFLDDYLSCWCFRSPPIHTDRVGKIY